MIKSFDSKITPFGGIHFLHKRLISQGAVQFIDNELGRRVINFGYNYSDIILGRIYTTFCGGNATGGVNYVKEETLRPLKGISIPSADTIPRGDIELSVPCTFINVKSGKENKVNINPKMNRFLIRSAIKFHQLDAEDKTMVYDFDYQFIPTEKYDATYSYKNKKGYFPGVASISNIPLYMEGRNGNCNVKTGQLATHKRALSSLAREGINPKYARVDSGSYLKDITDHFHDENILFLISKV